MRGHHRLIRLRDWEQVRPVVLRPRYKLDRVSADRLDEGCRLDWAGLLLALVDRRPEALAFRLLVRRRQVLEEVRRLEVRLLRFLGKLRRSSRHPDLVEGLLRQALAGGEYGDW